MVVDKCLGETGKNWDQQNNELCRSEVLGQAHGPMDGDGSQ